MWIYYKYVNIVNAFNKSNWLTLNAWWSIISYNKPKDYALEPVRISFKWQILHVSDWWAWTLLSTTTHLIAINTSFEVFHNVCSKPKSSFNPFITNIMALLLQRTWRTYQNWLPILVKQWMLGLPDSNRQNQLEGIRGHSNKGKY